MKNVTLKSDSRKNKIMQGMFLAAMVAMLAGALYYRGLPFAIASATASATSADAAASAVDVVIQILDVICIVLGAFALLFGLVNVAIAKLSEQSNKQNEALISSAVGLALILMGTVVLPSLKPTFVTLVQSAVQ